MIWWALEQKRKREQETNNRIKADLVAELLASDLRSIDKQKLEEWAKEKGILPGKPDTARKCRGCCCGRCA